MGFVKRFARRRARRHEGAKALIHALDPRSGGKGRGLLRLAEAGLRIPRTLVVPARLFRAHVDRSGPTPDAIRNTPVPAAWSDAWLAAARSLGAQVAVRSSALEEDGATRSFAGVHASRIGIAADDVVDAILDVWASAWSPEALAYGRAGDMAVLLQPSLTPHAAGVAFTIDPQSGSWREMVVEAVAGQGEALVSGRQAPQWFVLRRGTRLRIVDEGIVPQARRWAVEDGELVAGPHPTPDARLLAPDAVVALGRLCLRAERAIGAPADVEWAWDGRRFTLLQARPITTGGMDPRVRDVLWTRRFLGERLPRPPYPATFSLLQPVLDHFIGYPEVSSRYLGGGPSLQLARGHAYLNVTVFRHLLFKWPGAPAPSFMLELLPEDEAQAFRRRYRVAPDLAVYAAILRTTLRERRWERFAWNPFTNPAVWTAFEQDLPARLDALRAGGSRDRIRAGIRLLTDYLAIHVCSLLFANLAYQLLGRALARWTDDDPAEALARFGASEQGNRTLELNAALGALASTLGADGLAALREGHVSPATDAFLARYGARSEASWEIFGPRWCDDPTALADLVTGGTAPPPARPRTGHLPARHRLVLRGLIAYTRRYVLLRENQRFAFDRITLALRNALVARGADLGIAPDDVRWCTVDELLDGTVDPEAMARRRVAHAAADPRPPVFLRGDQPVECPPSSGARLRGQGISPGTVRGAVRVAHRLADAAALQRGEILVAPALDPGWTPLLARAGGVVLEMGSLLSHGAVVAREYGVPVVANVDGFARLMTGDAVLLDGTRGDVWLLEHL
jgi:pyruvate,water dikinase